MRRVWHIAGKELLQTRRDKLAALFTILLPVAFTVFLGFIITGGDENRALPVALLDLDGSAASVELIEHLDEQPPLDLQPIEETALQKAVIDQDVVAAVTIPAGYGAALSQGRSATVTLVRMEVSPGGQSVEAILRSLLDRANAETLAVDATVEQVTLVLERPVDAALREQAASLVSAALDEPTVTIKNEVAGGSKSRVATGFDQASMGSLVTWVLFSLLTIATGLTWERKHGLIRRMHTIGVRRIEVFGGKFFAIMTVAFLQQLFLVLLGQFAFGVDYFNNPVAVLVLMVSLSALAASLGLLISALFRSQQAIIATIVIASQLLAALGGAWFPLDITSVGFTRAAHFLPTAWIMDSFHGIVLKGWGLAELLFPLGIVWIWIVVLFGLAVWRFRPE